MNEQSLNEFLIKGRIASDTMRKQGKEEIALHILQITSLIALRQLPKSHKVICRTCKRQLHAGLEIEFYNHTGMCLTCDAAYSDSLIEQEYETEMD